ncbi:MAG: hypothetical protein KDE56_08050 [Anaerolineales bacterium]|nr:hypothetical protein [Anaerolineales bacterium]
MKNVVRWVGWITAGVLLGAAVGLYVGWVAWPVEYSEANPAVLQETYRQDYLLMVATVYGDNGDLALAEARLDGMGTNGRSLLLDTLLNMIVREAPEADLVLLARLARDVGLTSPAVERYAGGAP